VSTARCTRRLGVDHGMFHVFPILMPWSTPSRRVHRAVDTLVHQHLDPGRDPLDLSALR